VAREFSAPLRGALRRAAVGHAEPLPVHIIVSQTDRIGGCILVEMIEIEQQTRQEREERVHGQAEVTKELVRNLAHEIKNPLGGIRGAAQLLALDLPSPELAEYTQVIIHEADRLQTLVVPARSPRHKPHVVGDVNIHEVCERVRSGAGRASAASACSATTTHRSPSSAATASSQSGRAQHRAERRAGAQRANRGGRCPHHPAYAGRPAGHDR
jgi:two-component system nitrogen regulation sensor histidine kinase GlnL